MVSKPDEWIDANELLLAGDTGGLLEADLKTPWNPPRPLSYRDAATIAKSIGKPFEHQSDGTTLIRVGKKRVRRLLDGRLHNALPESPSHA